MNETTTATLGLVIIFSLVGGVISLIGGIFLLSRRKYAYKLAKYVTPFAAGALLAAVFLDLLPEGIHESSAGTVLLAALVGVLIFFMAERFLHWFHHHHQHEDEKKRGASLIVVGDTLHNALDGVAIAAGFLVSIPTGIVTTIAVAAHEIPQEIGDFGLLLNKGVSRARVLLINVLSALATTVAAVITFQLGGSEGVIGALLGLSAGFLLYIAASDIIPEIHQRAAKNRLFDWQPLLLLFGVLVVGAVINVAHTYIGHDHGDEAHAEHGHGSHSEAHGHGHDEATFEIADHDRVPTLELSLEEDSLNGYNLFIETTNFMFTPEEVNGEAEIGEGHAHVYINDEKYGRVYASAVHLPALEPGDEVRVTLNANDHSEFTHDGEPIETVLVAGEEASGHGHESEDHHHDESDHHHDE